ncbi:MAG: tRNA epoxyqueuosine(34) reductase QueG [Chloroflexi bacterium]|nr:tRNA epoxyqueuosine(34) reductase QueG [Chloroflexota bacterium]MCH2304330.1 tRNA epoxyqueuosine(34) reductase QueG [SAR202 cluster bacterium]|tara:strand:+ start:16110 stop:17243 length:1134 start_codon:yes stop_codon:yes gene_type:complete
MNSKTPEKIIKKYAHELGFDIIGITTAKPFLRGEKESIERIENGHMGEMHWYTIDRVQKANHPEKLLNDAKSIISLGISYFKDPNSDSNNKYIGKVAQYAWGKDYHFVIKNKLNLLVDKLSDIFGNNFKTRIFVDDGPMNDRAVAERAGVGWFGKNTNILTKKFGSWVFLSQILTTLDLKPDKPLKTNCGNCIKCIDKCPTNAIIAPYKIDARKCIAYLTIEHRGAIPIELRPHIQNWIFGCDICQEVCPVNDDAEATREDNFISTHNYSLEYLISLLEISEEEFRIIFKNSAIKRAKRVGLQRNICIALGNIKDPKAVPALAKALTSKEVLIRQHAAWALGQIKSKSSLDILIASKKSENSFDVLSEIELAINNKF